MKTPPLLSEWASGSDPVSTILAGALTIIHGAPLILGLGIQGILMSGALVERVQRGVPFLRSNG